MGRRGEFGFVQLLRGFYEEEFFTRNRDDAGLADRSRTVLRPELREFCFENRSPGKSGPKCPVCGLTIVRARRPAHGHAYCPKCGAPMFTREDSVMRLVRAKPEWQRQLREFISREIVKRKAIGEAPATG